MIKPNIAYFSGAHGSGKSTLISRLVSGQPEIFQRLERIKIPKQDNVLEREKIMTARYYLQTFYENEFAIKNADKILLCDRCALDNLAYEMGFVKLGWSNENHFKKIVQLYEILFQPERMPNNIIFIDPSLETLIKNIKKRWETQPKKWREENFEYLDAVRASYQEFYSTYNGNILHLKEENIEERAKLCREWMLG